MKVTFDHPHFDKGTVFEIPGIGAVENGKEIELDKAQLEAYEQREGEKFSGKDGNFKGGKSLEKSQKEAEEAAEAAAEEAGEPVFEPPAEEGGEG